MISVLALEMSRPVSMIVVQMSTSNFLSQKSRTTCSSRCSPIWPWAVAMRASGTSSRMRAAAFSIEVTLLWTRKTWPSRSSSRRIAAVICFSS